MDVLHGQSEDQQQSISESMTSTENTFIEEVRRNLLKAVDDELRLPFQNLGKTKHKYLPQMSVMIQVEKTDFRNAEKILTTQGVLEKKSGVELKDITLSELHEKFEGEGTKLIFLVGNVGSGKTVTSKRYAKQVSKGKIKSLAHVELVHHVQVYDLPDSDNTTALELLFVQTELSRKQKPESEEWFSQKSKRNKTLLVLDGLDQSAKSFREKDFRKVRDPEFKTSTNAILANLLSGQLYEGINILSTSRWLTYWKLKGQLHAAKVVVLKGFSETNVISLLTELVGYQPQSIDPTMLSLCKDPVFLVYLAEILIQKGDLPEIFSEMMVLVIRYFIDCGHNQGDVSKLMKIAYHGMKDKRYSFSAKYLKKYGISVEDMKDLINVTAKRIMACSQPNVQEHNLVFAYQHQSLQEVLASLHSLTLEPEQFQKFVSEDLKEESMVVVRRELYGIILNERTRRVSELFTEDANCSHDVCERILLNDLESLFQTKQIDNMELVILLYECGSSVSPILERIQIIENMIWDGTNTVWMQSVIDKCSNLQKLQFISFVADSNSVTVLENFMHKTQKLIINVFHISDGVKPGDILRIKRSLSQLDIQLITSLKCSDEVAREFLSPSSKSQNQQRWKLSLDREFEMDTYCSLAHFVAEENIERLDFDACRIEDEQFGMLVEEIPPGKKISTIVVYENGIAAPTGYYYLAKLLSRVNVVILAMTNCKLTDQKLDYFNRAAQKTQHELQLLQIEDDTMLPSAYRILASTVKFTKPRRLVLVGCHLTSDKLKSFNKAAIQENVKVDHLQIEDAAMEAFDDLAATCEMSNVMIFKTCALTVEKLRVFIDAAPNHDINFTWLTFADENMQEDVFSILPEVVSVTRANGIAFEHCNLSGKVWKFSQAAAERNIQVEWLQTTNEDLHTEDYAEIAHALHIMGSYAWIIGNCHLTDNNLKEFNKEAEAVGLQLSLICVEKGHNLPVEQFAQTIAVTNTQDVQICRSDISRKQLRLLRNSLRKANAKLRRFYFWQEDLLEESFVEIAEITDVTKAEYLSLDACSLNPARMTTFLETLQKLGTQLRELLILRNPSVDYETFKITGELIKCTAVKDFIIARCGLTHTKLKDLLLALQEIKVQVANVIIYDTETLSDESFDVISALFLKAVTVNKPAGSLTTTIDLLSWNSSLFEKMEYFAISNKSLSATDMKYLARICRNAWLTVLWLNECDPTKSKLDALYENLKSDRTQVTRLILSQITFEPTEDDIIALARLLSVVRQKLVLVGWQITVKYMRILQEAVDETSNPDLVIELKNADQTDLIARSIVPEEEKSVLIETGNTTITMSDCRITFPEKAFENPALVRALAQIDRSKWPKGYIVITAMLYIEAKERLQKPANVLLKSWCKKGKSKVPYAHVLHLPDGATEWRVITELPLNNDAGFMFDCMDFSPVCVGIPADQFGDETFSLESLIFVKPILNTFAVIFSLSTELVCDAMRRRMRRHQFQNTLPVDRITAIANDVLGVHMTCVHPAGFSFQPTIPVRFQFNREFITVREYKQFNFAMINTGAAREQTVTINCEIYKNDLIVDAPHCHNHRWKPEQSEAECGAPSLINVGEGAVVHNLDLNLQDTTLNLSEQQNQTHGAGFAVQGAAADQPGTSASQTSSDGQSETRLFDPGPPLQKRYKSSPRQQRQSLAPGTAVLRADRELPGTTVSNPSQKHSGTK